MTTRTASGCKAAAMAAVLIMVSVAFIPMTGVTDDDDAWYDESDAIAPLIIWGVGLGLGFLSGLLSGYLVHDITDPGLSEDYTDEVNASLYRTWLETQLNSLENGVSIDTQTLALTQMYWSRSAEVVVSGLWSDDTNASDYYDRILADSTYSQNVGNLYRSWESLMDQPFDQMSSWPSDSENSGYSGMTYSFYAGDSKIAVDSSLRYDSGTYVDPGTGKNRVYISTVGSDSTDGMSTLYVLGSSGTLVDDHGSSYNLTKGKYDISDFAEGYYTLYGGPFIGPFTSAGSNAADLHGAFAQISDGEIHCLYAANEDIFYDGTAVGDAGITVSWGDGANEVASSVKECLLSWDGMISSIEKIASDTLSAASAEWLLFDGIGSANPYASLTMYTPDLANLDLTAEQRYLIGLLCMRENYAWYTGTSTSDVQISASDVAVTKESLQLTVTGDILDSAQNVIAEDVVYTPMGWTNDIQLTSGGTTQWTQQGFAVVWGKASDWNGETDISEMSIVTLTPGMSVSADAIEYKGTEVPSMVLEVKGIDLVLSDYEKIDPPPVPSDDYTGIVMAVLIALGAIVLFLGLRSGRPIELLFGAALIALGVFASGMISDMITGDFEWGWF